MTSDSIPVLFDESGHPASVPAGDVPARSLVELEPEALRRAHSRDESYLKAVGRLNYLYAFVFALYASYFIRFSYMHLTGAISVPWAVRPGWVALQFDWVFLVILTLNRWLWTPTPQGLVHTR